MTVDSEIISGLCDDEMSAYVPGINCIDCGRFVGRDGWIGVGYFEMSNEVAYVEGLCRCCLTAEERRAAARARRKEAS